MKYKLRIKIIIAIVFSFLFATTSLIPKEIAYVFAAQTKSITIANQPYQLYTGDTYSFRATTSGFHSSKLVWYSSNKKVATIDYHTGILNAKKSGTTKITVKDKDSGIKSQLTITIKAATKQKAERTKATYLSGLNLSKITDEYYTTKKEEFIDTTRFLLYIQKDVILPVNIVDTFNHFMNLMEAETKDSFYPMNYHTQSSNYILTVLDSTFKNAKELKKRATSQDKIIILITNDPNTYSQSYGSFGCMINTYNNPLSETELPSELLNHFLYTLLSRNGTQLTSCLSDGYINYYKEKLLSNNTIFNSSHDYYATMQGLREKIESYSIEKLFINASAGDESSKLGYRIVTYLMETYGTHSFKQFHRSFSLIRSNATTIKSELNTLKQQFGDNVLTEFSDWYGNHRTQFNDEDLSLYGDWMINEYGYLYKYFGDDSELVVPDTVCSIEPTAFKNCDTIKTIQIPDTVTSIGGGAFLDCKNLVKIKLPNRITKIYVNTFDGCSSLKKVVLPETVMEILSCAFAYCTSLANIELPNGLTTIGGWAFVGCSKLSSVSLPETLKSIGPSAFSGCNITKITIPKSVTEIGDNAFGSNPKLTIYGVSGSYAEVYAKQNNYKFVANK